MEDRVFVSPVDASAKLTCCDIGIRKQADLMLSALRCTIVGWPENRPVIAPGIWVGDLSVDSEHVEDIVEGIRPGLRSMVRIRTLPRLGRIDPQDGGATSQRVGEACEVE